MATIPSDEALQESARARERGNDLYKAGKLVQAESAYTEAARLARHDPRPLSNVAAVKFEMGNYLGAALFSEKALKLCEAQSDEVLEQKICLRLAKSYLYCGKYAQCRSLVPKITGDEERSSLNQSLSSNEALSDLVPSETHLWEQVLDRLPRYKPSLLLTINGAPDHLMELLIRFLKLPSMLLICIADINCHWASANLKGMASQKEAEYFSVGHDGAETEFTPEMADSSQESFSFLFCGIGDARNLFATLAFISMKSVEKPSLSSKNFYFSLLDVKPTVFARDLLIFQMLDDSSTESLGEKSETLVTISYCFGAQVMPFWAYDRFQKAIKDLLSGLENRNSDILGRFGVDHETRETIARHLRNWQKPPERWYSTVNILNLTREQNMKRRVQNMAEYGSEFGGADSSLPPGCDSVSPDFIGYTELNVMLPFMHMLEKHEPQLLKLFTKYMKTRTPVNKRKLDQYFEEKWKPNMTLIDFDWEESREKPDVLLDFLPAEVVSDLFAHIPASVAGTGVRGILPHFVGFFDFIQISWSKIKQQTAFEIVVGEMISFMERLNHNLLRRETRFMSLNPSTYPNQYDGIHMSNIPDYTGGPLSTFLYGLPALRRGSSSKMTSNCQRNPRIWIRHDQFLHEYLLFADQKMIRDTFGASLSDRSRQMEKVMDGVLVAGKGAIMIQPISWTRTTISKLAWSQLMPRQRLERWLFAHFLKLCVPSWRPKRDNELVYSPLNLTIFFRLVIHLSKIGYPAHWLSGVLDSICSGNITTRARAPRSMVSDRSSPEYAPDYPTRTMSVKPFLAEFTTLLSIFRRLLPFKILLTQDTLPRLDVIQQYSLVFKPDRIFKYRDLEQEFSSIFMLVFCHRGKLDKAPVRDLRAALLDDEDADPAYKVVHAGAGQESPIHAISTWNWNTKSSTASFWLTQTIVDDMLENSSDWDVYIWRSDTWTPALGPLPFNESTVVRGQTWY